ncbi:MAG: hypothetical protein E7092_04890 [Bacteroidales bacterium]|nr:hypothetical protein [Bacteroidales bacterium]
MKLKDKIDEIWQRKSVRQIASLFSVNILGIPLGLVTNILVTRYMGAELFGDYKFICSVFNFGVLFATFGFFQAGNRAIILSKNREETRSFYGAMHIILAALFVLMSIGLLLFIRYDSNIAEKGLTAFFTSVIPFGFVYLWGNLYETILPADNQIGLLAKLRLYPKLINLAVVALLYFYANEVSSDRLLIILSLYTFTQFILYLYVTFKVKPTLRSWKTQLREVYNQNKKFGLNVYFGALFAIGFAHLTEILISVFGINNTEVGFYSLAITFSQPLTFIPSTIATTHYRSFSSAKRISRKLINTTLILSISSVLALWLLVPSFITYFYDKEFEPVIKINFLLCIAVFFYGISDFYNRFLQANGWGKELRNASFAVGLTTLIGNLLFIPHFGACGAAYARITTGIVYLIIMLYYYKKLVKIKESGEA